MMPWLITAFTVITVFLLDKWENKYLKSVFDWLPVILLAYIIPAIISLCIGQSFADHEIHEYSKLYFIPLAIITVMSSLSINQLFSIGWKPIILFFSGSFWIALFPVAIVLLFEESHLVKEVLVNHEYWKGIPPIVGSWIGGSTSQLVLKELVECPENIFLSILILDNLLVNIWTILMFQGIKESYSFNRWLGISNLDMPEELHVSNKKRLNSTISFIILVLVVLMTNVIADSFRLKVILLSFFGLAFGNVGPNWNDSFALKLGSILILTVMAVLGLKLSISSFNIELALLAFLIVWLVGHLLFMLFIAIILNVNIAWVPIASMANVGGIATAPAVTAAYQEKWMPHAIILAILSMATGTFWGIVTIYLITQFM